MYNKFEQLINTYEKDIKKDNSIRIVDRKVGDEFLQLSVSNSQGDTEGLTYNKKVKRFNNDKVKLENGIMNNLKTKGKVYFPDSNDSMKMKNNAYKSHIWTDKHEMIYKYNKSEARRVNSKHYKSATFADCALSSFVYTYMNNKTTDQCRNELLDKYVYMSIIDYMMVIHYLTMRLNI